MLKRLLYAVSFLAIVSLGFSQSVGKISGVVKDKDSGEALPGVNVVLKETFLGASTDVDGYFVILNVPAGTYTVSFSYIGYQPVDIENVRVVTDLTKRLDVDLASTTIEIDEAIVVIAERPFFEVSATNTTRVLDADEIERIPIKGVNSIVSINAGVVAADGSGGDTDNATINVRGGRGNETLFIVDGIPMNDVLLGNASGTIPDVAIEQVSSQIGGFNAKYGSAQSGVVNITTKSGASRFFGSLDLINSNLTDDFNYGSYSGSFGGPLFSRKLSFFLSGEYLKTDDEIPRASGLVIPTAGIDQKARPEQGGEVVRFTGKVDASFQQFKITLSGNGSMRDGRRYFHQYAKDNSLHQPKRIEDVFGGSLRFSHVISPTTFWDVTFRGRAQYWTEMDNVFEKNIELYGDAEANRALGVELDFGDGSRVGADDVGVFWRNGRVPTFYWEYEILTGGADLNFTKQFKNHLLEIGGSYEQHQVSYYSVIAYLLANNSKGTGADPRDIRYNNAISVFYGYDIFGNKNDNSSFRTITDPNTGSTDDIEEAGPKRPVIAGAYIQDRIEFQDFILNLGARWDHFNADHYRFRDPQDIYGFGPNTNRLDPEDLEPMPAEDYISPRLGFAFPVTETTVFHAQYGIFRQAPRFNEIYDSWNNLMIMEQRDGQGQNNGWIKMEKTTQYEFGFKQQLGNVASLDLTAYYKNVEGLINLRTERTAFGQTTRKYITTANQDFGTIKGFSFNFNLRRLGPISTKVDYTLALSEGTGSDPSSSRTATFRNPNNEIPLAIAPLDFDQRHTLTANIDIRGGRGEGPTIFGTKLFSEAGANFLWSFNSGRPYTPVEQVNPLESDQGLFGSTTTQYVNSAYMGGVSRIDVRVDKQIRLMKDVVLVPYLWIQNLLDTENYIDVWRSTGKPDETGYLNTPDGQQRLRLEAEKGEEHLQAFISDVKALERDPTNYGLPRLIRLGLRLKF